ncbi:MAG TPA: glycoside hydrolase family 43 protein [Acidimicrobiales bacterium]|nr:glycoside hydrolase family 43 protein [Acidimicrobiales bacterium]
MFRNPLHGRPFADPFVLKFNGRYYAYGTPGSGGLPALRSTDLVHWKDGGEVLGPPPPGRAHWAPEVAYDNGRFFLYHSTGGEEGENHQLRVATATSPTGPFDEDLGLLDAEDPFTIDAHPFRDDDGEWYLFYSRDFLEGEPVGTGIVVDRLVDMTSLGGERTTVMRPHSEWHLYERQRRWYDRVWDWYTVEGPFVRKHDGRYWCFYSGGAWKAENYGISSAVADHPMGPYEAVVAEDTADVLRTVPGRVIGPGHGSVAVAPDNVTEYLIYHAWDLEHTGRFLHADRLLWDEGRPQSPGPCSEPQPCPPEPLFRDLFDDRGGSRWVLERGWAVDAGRLVHPGGASAAALADVTAPSSYLFECNLAVARAASSDARAGVVISHQDDANHTVVSIDPHSRELAWHAVRDGERCGGAVLGPLRSDFAADAYHHVVLRRCGDWATVALDGVHLGQVPAPNSVTGRVGVWTGGTAVHVEGVALTDLAPGQEPAG